tara:strand:+ start:74 stop:208 length:135 start_codon:yes stop_codon:yes gene_type:complete
MFILVDFALGKNLVDFALGKFSRFCAWWKLKNKGRINAPYQFPH